MDIPRNKNKLVFPRDCEKLDIENCENYKLEGRCKIKYNVFGGKNRCVPNETYLLDKEIRSKGFKEFASLDEENIAEDLEKRNTLCKSLTKTACNSPQAKVLGCQYKSGYFKKGRCGLAEKIIKYYYRIDKTCLVKGCNEPKQKGFKLCEMHRLELNDKIEMLTMLHGLIMKGENIEENYIEFIDTYNLLLDSYSIYLVESPATLTALTEKYNEIRVFLGEDACQCINISSCIGKGSVGEFCQNKGIKTENGLMCPKHRACYKDRKKKFLDFKKTFEKLCSLKSCKKELEELENFYKMILFTTQGEVSIIKRDLMDYLFIIRQYIKENN